MTIKIVRHELDPTCQVVVVVWLADSDPAVDYYCGRAGYSPELAARRRNECPSPETRSPSRPRPEAQHSPAWGAERSGVPPCCRAIEKVTAIVWARELECMGRDDARPAAGGQGGDDGETRCSARPSLPHW